MPLRSSVDEGHGPCNDRHADELVLVRGSMSDLLDEMRQCKSVKACIELAITDAYGDYEQANAWLTCIETMFGRYKRVFVIGEDAALDGFELVNDAAIVAVC